MAKGLKSTDYQLEGQTGKYTGKVRDVYEFEDQLVIVVSDRLSAFDVVLPEPIPYKGQVLNQMTAKLLAATADIVPNWVLHLPDSNVTIGKRCVPFAVEIVIRGYLAGHAWREYKAGKREICGVTLPNGLIENDRLPSPILTPTTKAHTGHDEDISREEIIRQNIVTKSHYTQIERYAKQLFQRGTDMVATRGLILVDSKYEFGLFNNEITLIDEIHTPDSSRYFYKNSYEDLQKQGLPQKQLSKEFVRQWLISEGFQGLKGQTIPEMTVEKINSISERYIELYEKILGENFQKEPIDDISTRIEKNIKKAISLHTNKKDAFSASNPLIAKNSK